MIVLDPLAGGEMICNQRSPDASDLVSADASAYAAAADCHASLHLPAATATRAVLQSPDSRRQA